MVELAEYIVVTICWDNLKIVHIKKKNARQEDLLWHRKSIQQLKCSLFCHFTSLTFLFLWQQIAQSCQKNNIKIWWISEDWDSACVIIMVKVNSHGDSSYPLLEHKTAVRGVLCSFTSLQCHFQLPRWKFSFLQFGAALPRCCCVSCMLWQLLQCSAGLRVCAGRAGGLGCLQRCMQHVQPSGCVMGLRALAIGRVPSTWKAVCCCSS